MHTAHERLEPASGPRQEDGVAQSRPPAREHIPPEPYRVAADGGGERRGFGGTVAQQIGRDHPTSVDRQRGYGDARIASP
jgi:hypothetical protein